jgi:putative AlgH/UPF0301 family transcriptional regulator
MSLRRRLLFAMLIAIAALAASAGAKVYKAEYDAPKLRGARALMPASAESTWLGSQPANKSDGRLQLLRWNGRLHEPSLVPIQFKDPAGLGPGKLLVASRGLPDPNFAKTVVLLVHYDEKGVLGLVLNQRTEVPISKVFDLKAAKDRTDPVYIGGPVEHSAVFALVESSEKMEKAEDIFGRVYLVTDKGEFEQILSTHPQPDVFHVYLGYAGWTQDQLRAEVKSGAWFVFPADATAVFNSHPDTLWLKMMQKTKLQWAKNETFTESFQPFKLYEY